MAERSEREVTRLLDIAEEATRMNDQVKGRPTGSDPIGWGTFTFGDAAELRGLVAGLRYALGIEDKLAEGLSGKGARRFLEDREAERVEYMEIYRRITSGELRPSRESRR